MDGLKDLVSKTAVGGNCGREKSGANLFYQSLLRKMQMKIIRESARIHTNRIREDSRRFVDTLIIRYEKGEVVAVTVLQATKRKAGTLIDHDQGGAEK